MATCRSGPKLHLPITIGTKPIEEFTALDVLDGQNSSGLYPSAPGSSALEPHVVTEQPSIQPSAPPINTMAIGDKVHDSALPYPYNGEYYSFLIYDIVSTMMQHAFYSRFVNLWRIYGIERINGERWF